MNINLFENELQKRKHSGTLRTLAARESSDEICDLSGNNYLNLSTHPLVIKAATEATKQWGCSSSASPLVSGYTTLHQELEETLCKMSGFPHALLWNTGYAANHSILSLFPQKRDVVLADKLIHNSMISGLMHGQARLIRYQHSDLDQLESLLDKQTQPCFVVTESVFSMDGDYPDLQKIAELKDRFGFFWIVDEAHATGWFGANGMGLVEAMNLQSQVDILVGTLGKALGSMGAYTLFNNASLRSYCINFSGEFIYSTYLNPAAVGAAIQALKIVKSSGEKSRLSLQKKSREFRRKLASFCSNFTKNIQIDSPIVPVIIGDTNQTLSTAEKLQKHGYKVGAIRPPTVPAGTSRLRISLNQNFLNSGVDDFLKSLRESIQ